MHHKTKIAPIFAMENQIFHEFLLRHYCAGTQGAPGRSKSIASANPKKTQAPGDAKMLLPGRPGRPRETQRDTKNRPKIVFLLKKGVPSVDVCRFLCARPLFQAFCAMVHRFFTENRWKIDEKNDACFQSVARFFEHGDPHETPRFTIRKLLFHVLCFCIFSKKNSKK